MTSFRSVIFNLCLITASADSFSATVIQSDLLVSGDNGINYVEETGLNWLDTSYTLGMS